MTAEAEYAAVPITVTVNGIKHDAVVEPRTLLVYFLREHLGLTGTHVGCDTSQCGACTVHLDGRAVKSCTILAAQANGAEIKTIEGLANGDIFHPVQEGFREKHGLQCGYCTPGMIMTAVHLLETNSNPTDDEIKHALEGNICRCTGYVNIVESVKWAAAKMGGKKMFPASFGYVAARSVEEALELMVKHGEDGKLLAGGHSLIPAMKLRLQSPRTLIDLGTVPGLRGVRQEGAELVIGALTVHADVAASELVRKHLPGLADAASVIGDLQVRNRGTIGGSVAHADPAADLPVILTALDASFAVRSPTASRTIAVDDFFTDFYTTAMNSDEILTEIHVPIPPAGMGSAYAKLPHPASGYVVVSAGALITRQASGTCASARIAIGGLSSGPVRAVATEIELQGKPLTPQMIAAAAAKAAEETDPVEDSYASAEYKRHVATIYARKAIEAAVERAKG